MNDAVYLHNGSILRGKVIETVEDRNTKIELIGHTVLVIPQTEIEKVVLDEPVSQKASVVKPAGVEVQPTVNFFGGSKNSAGFTVVTGYRFPFRLSAGAGMGVEWFTYQVMPVYADFTYCPIKGNFTPLVYARAGYSFPLGKPADDQYSDTDYKGGAMFGAGIGLRRYFANHNAFIFSIGYRFQQLKTVTSYSYWYGSQDGNWIERIDRFKRIGVSIGFLFD